MSRKRSRRVPTKQGRHQIVLWKKLLFAAVVCLTFFILLELTLWTVGIDTLIEQEDPFRGFSSLVTVFEPHGDVYRTRPSNLGSFNDQSFLAEKLDNGYRIFCLGGSSSHGFPWGAEAAFTSIVGEAVATSHPELHVEAINASGVAYAMHRLNIVADELLSYDPDVFIIYSGHNEFVEPAFFDALKRRSPTRTRLEYALSHSRAYSGLRTILPQLKEVNPSPTDEFGSVVRPEQTRVFSPDEKKAVVAEFHWRLQRLVRRAQKAGIRVVLATVPANLRQWQPEASSEIAILSEADRQKWSQEFTSGKRHFDAGEFRIAATNFQRAAQLGPQHAETQFLLAQTYDKLGQWDLARAAYQRACDADASPNRRLSEINEAIRDVAHEQRTVLLDMDHIFEQQSEHGLIGFDLIEDFVHPNRKGHEIIAWHVWDAMERAGWFGSKKPGERSVFDNLIAERRRRPTEDKNAMWFYNQGVLLEKQGHTEEAIEKYRQAVELAPGYPMATLNLGAMLTQQGQHSEAFKLFQQLIKIDPNSAQAHNGMGAALYGMERIEEAVTHYRNALRIQPEFAGAHYNWGRALQTLGQRKEAIKHYRKALQIQPDYIEVHCNWGNILQSQGHLNEAVEHYQQALLLKPDSTIARVNWGNALLAQGQFEQAIVHYQEALRIKLDFAEVHNNWAQALQGMGRFEEAVAHCQQALQLRPDLAMAHINCGDALLQMSRYEQAIRHYRLALQTNPNLARAYNNWGVVLVEQQKLQEAVQKFQQAMRLQPNYGDARNNLQRVQAVRQQNNTSAKP